MSNIEPTTAEFSLIARLKETLARGAAGDRHLVCGIGDDAAVLRPDPDLLLVTCTDTLVSGVHFPAQASPADIGWKALAVNLSDLAAMGARPRWAQLSLTLPAVDDNWLDDFIQGWQALASQHEVVLIGGDTTRGPLSITVQLLGDVAPTALLTRDGGRAGDLLAVTGRIGGAALALHQLQSGQQPTAAALARLHRPAPRVAVGRVLAGLATSCIDLSDGLVNDLPHLLKASATGAQVQVDQLPVDGLLDGLAPQQRLDLAIGGGDDYELCLSLPKAHLDTARARLADLGVDLTPIGNLTDTGTLQWQGAEHLQISAGWRHFEGGSA